MAKSSFLDGSYLTPAFVQSIYGSSADDGHLHDGVDADGHASKIDLAAHVKNLLPMTNMDLVLPGMIHGMQISMPAGYRSIQIGQGMFVDTGMTFLIGTAGMTKNIILPSNLGFVNWVPGTGGGVLYGTAFTGDQWLHVFAIYNPTTATTDFCCDTDIGGSNILYYTSAPAVAGYTAIRRVGSIFIVLTSSGPTVCTIRPYTQTGDLFTWDDMITTFKYISISSTGTVQKDMVYVPDGLKVNARLAVSSTSNGYVSGVTFVSGDMPSPSSVTPSKYVLYTWWTHLFQCGEVNCMTDTARKIRINYYVSGSGTSSIITADVMSYVDRRGQDLDV